MLEIQLFKNKINKETMNRITELKGLNGNYIPFVVINF